MRPRIRIWALAIFTALCWHLASASNQHEAKTRQEWTLDREGAQGLLLRSPAGNVRVVAGERDQIHIEAEKRARADREETAREFLDRMKIERRREGGRWVIEATWPEARRQQVNSPYVNFEIHVPRGFDLDARTGGGNVEVGGLGDARLHTGGGNVAVRDVAGLLDVDTGGGNVEVTGGRDARLNTGGGNIAARGVSGKLKAHTGGGNIEIDGNVGAADVDTGGGNIVLRRVESPVKAATGGGNIDVTVARAGDAADVDLRTGAGEIELRLPDRVSARVEAETGLGRVEMEPAGNARFKRDRSHLEAVLGEGRGSVRLRTGVGGIRIRLASER